MFVSSIISMTCITNITSITIDSKNVGEIYPIQKNEWVEKIIT